MTPELSWDVPVIDGLNRERNLVVAVSDGRVVLLPPPGEGFTLPLQSVRLLDEALRAAAFESTTTGMRFAT